MKTIIFLLITVLNGVISAQHFSLTGKVTDSANGAPVQGALVFISYNYFSYTNNEGAYIIKDIQAGDIAVRVSRLGYKSALLTLTGINQSEEKNFSLEQAPIELDEVLVNTNRTGKYLRNSPFSELIVGSSVIEEKPAQSVSNLLENQPGISLMRDGIWGTEVTIRGLSRENVITLIDGNRIATSTDVAARLSMIDIGDVERIEVIKGASSSIYGSGATGGIVNVITKSPPMNDKLTLSGNLSAGFNSVNNLSAFAGSLYNTGSFWSSKITGSYRKAGNTQTPAGELKNSQFKDYSFSGALNVNPAENHLLKFNYQLFKAEDVGIPGASAFPENAEVRYPDEKRELFSGAYEIQNISELIYKVSARYSFQSIRRNVENIPHQIQNIPASGTSPAKRVSVLKITPLADHKNNNLQLQGNLSLAEENNLIVGIDYWDRSYLGERQKYQKIEVLNSSGGVVSTTNKVIGEKPLPDSKFKSFGVFVQDDADLIKEKLSLSLGARLDKITVDGESTLNPIYEIVNGVINYAPAGQKTIWNKVRADESSYSANAGFKYSLSGNFDITLSLGYSFRSPSLEERFQYIDQGSYVRIGNPNLNPEKGKSADLGFRYYSPALKIITSVFYNYFDDLVAEIPGTFDGRNAYIKTNIGQARLYGFDLHADYNFYGTYLIYVTASYVKGDDITASGNLADIPPLNGSVGVKLGLFNAMELDLSSTIFSAQNKVAAGEIKTPGYASFNLYVNSNPFRFGFIDLRVSAGIENIFDKEYRNHLSTSRGLIKDEPGRNVFVKINLNW